MKGLCAVVGIGTTAVLHSVLNSSHSFMLFFWFSLTMNEDITHSARNMGKVADSWECLVTMEKHF